MAVNDFQPRFVAESEFQAFGLPDATLQPDIVTLVERASTLIDESCGRMDTDGNGSLVYATYTERILLPPGRNVFRISFKPLATVSAATVAVLAVSGSATGKPNWYYTGVTVNDIYRQGNLSPLISASGRYGYSRRYQQQSYPDLQSSANVLQLSSFFGGPPQWTAIDISQTDFEPRTGELWVPTGLYPAQYTEVQITYNSGFDPRHMPRTIKHVCASLVMNFLSRGGGATGLKGFTAGRVSAQFTEELLDPTLNAMLQPFRSCRAI